MSTRLPCPNPACSHVFATDQVHGAAALVCPVCGTRFQFRATPPTAKPGAAAPAAPRPAPLAKPIGQGPSAPPPPPAPSSWLRPAATPEPAREAIVLPEPAPQ